VSDNPNGDYRRYIHNGFSWLRAHGQPTIDRLNYLSPFLTAVATGLLAWLAWWQWQTLEKTDHTLQQTMIASGRAWIAVTGARVDDDFQEGSTLRVRLSFENTGKEVAQMLSAGWNWIGPFPVIRDAKGTRYIPIDTVPKPTDNYCAIDVSGFRFGYPLYPGAKFEQLVYAFSGPQGTLPKSFLEKESSFVIYGCIQYRTFGVHGVSPYCLYWQPARNRRIEESTFEFCPFAPGIAK
jgi:hypothetical protein